MLFFKKLLTIMSCITSVVTTMSTSINFNNINNFNTWLSTNDLSSEFYGNPLKIYSNQICLNIKSTDGNGNTHSKDGRERQEIKSLLKSKWSIDTDTELPVTYQVQYKLKRPFPANVNRWFHIFQIKFEKSALNGYDGGTPLFTIGFLNNKAGIYIKPSHFQSQQFYPIIDVSLINGMWLTSIITITQSYIDYTLHTNSHTYTMRKKINMHSWEQSKLRFKFGLYRKYGGTNTICYKNIKMTI